jgi:Zn-dependent peptidase ImmA (M78 family)
MKVGTPGFVGERLRAARAARGIAAASLSDIVGVTPAAVSQYENGQQSPATDVMQRICAALNLPIEYFLRVQSFRAKTLFYRSFSRATVAARRRAQSRYEWMREIVQYVKGKIRISEARFPDFKIPEDPSRLDNTLIEQLATATRRHWGLGDGAISNVSWLLENNGAIVVRHNLESRHLDAFSEWDHQESRPYIVLGADKESAVRSRYDVAHELGHMVLHRKIDSEKLQLKELFSLVESQADRFAGAFLLPAASFRREVGSVTLERLRILKSRLKLSIGMMIKRAFNLGLISAETERRLWIEYSKRGWKRREPLDDTIPVEEPRFLQLCLKTIVEQRGADKTAVARDIGLGWHDIESLVGLERGSLCALNAVREEVIEEPKAHIIQLHRSSL